MFIKIIVMPNKEITVRTLEPSMPRPFSPLFDKFQSQDYFIKAHTFMSVELRAVLLFMQAMVY